MSQDVVLNGTTLCAPNVAPDQIEANRPVAFRVMGELGQGGMGVVYRAEQLYPRRIVALKVMKRSIADAHSRKRFIREVEITGYLSHRGITQLYFAGVLQDQMPFMAMEYVNGMPLLAYAQAHRLSTSGRLQLFAKICDIIAYAHRQGVIHRDLKPSNILVDAGGEPKVLDFGLASGPLNAQATQLTVQGQMVGTLDYMSPEQAEGRTDDVDVQSDVYSLGVLLYELLATRRPFDFSSISLIDAVRVIKETNPPRLSGVDRSFRGDLDTIVHKTLCKDKAGRYGSVDELAADIRRWQSHEPILARRPSAGYRTSRFIRRHRVFVLSVSLIILALTGGLIAATYEAAIATTQATRASDEARRANSGEARLKEEFAAEDVQMAHLELTLGDKFALEGEAEKARDYYARAGDRLERNQQSTLEVVLAVWELDQKYARKIQQLRPKSDGIQQLAISRDQSHIALGFADGTVEVRNPIRNDREFGFKLNSGTGKLIFTPDGKQLMAVGSADLEIWSIDQQQRVARFSIKDFLFSPMALGNDRFLCPTADGHVHVVFWTNPQRNRDLSSSSLDPRAINLDGESVVLVDHDWRIWRSSAETGELKSGVVLPIDKGSSDYIGISPDGGHGALTRDSAIEIFDLSTGNSKVIDGYGRPFPAGFIDSSTLYACALNGSRLGILDLQGKCLRQVLTTPLATVAVSRDLAAITDPSDGLTLWSIAPLPETRLLVSGEEFASASALSPEGKLTAVALNDGMVRLVENTTGVSPGAQNVGGVARMLRFSQQATSLAIVTQDHHVQVWNLPRFARSYDFKESFVGAFAFSRKGDLIVTSGIHELAFHRLTNGQWTRKSVAFAGNPTILEISPDSQRFFLVDLDGHGETWDAGPVPVRLPKGKNFQEIGAWNSQIVLQRNRSLAVNLWDPSDAVLTGTLPGPHNIVDVAASEPWITAIDRQDLNFYDVQGTAILRSIKLPLPSSQRILTSDDGMKVLLESKDGVLFLDLSIPEALRALDAPRHQTGGDAHARSAVFGDWLRKAGLEDLSHQLEPP